MIYTININKDKSYSDIQTITGYIGKNSENFDKVTVTEDERNVMETYHNAAVGDLTTSLFDFKPIPSGNQIKIEIPCNFANSILGAVEKEVEEFLVSSISSKWFLKSDPSLSKDYENKAKVNLINIRLLLSQRKKPEIR